MKYKYYLLIISIAIGFFFVSNSYAEKYTDYKGEELSQETYDLYMSECYKLKSDNKLDEDVDCSSWVLTEDGFVKIFQSIVVPSFEEFLEDNNIKLK
jgi:hypothetical protein